MQNFFYHSMDQMTLIKRTESILGQFQIQQFALNTIKISKCKGKSNLLSTIVPMQSIFEFENECLAYESARNVRMIPVATEALVFCHHSDIGAKYVTCRVFRKVACRVAPSQRYLQ